MIQKIVDGICQALSREFTEQEYEIYTESVEQGLKVPCFSVLMLKASIERQSEHRYQKTYPFGVQYFPESEEPYAECQAILERLYRTMELIKTEIGNLRGTELSGQISDGVLVFTVNYGVFAGETTALPEMTEASLWLPAYFPALCGQMQNRTHVRSWLLLLRGVNSTNLIK